MDDSLGYLIHSLEPHQHAIERARAFVPERVLARFEGAKSAPAADAPDDIIEPGPGERPSPALLRESAILTYAIIGELRRRQFRLVGEYPLARRRPFWSRSSTARLAGPIRKFGMVGLLDPDSAARTPGFGITLHATPRSAGARAFARPGNFLVFDRLGLFVPIVLSESRLELHAPPGPTNGTSTCYAERRGERGIVTAGHLFAVSDGRRPVPFLDGVEGRLRRTGYPVIDAAFVERSIPEHLVALDVLDFPTAGQRIVMDARSGRHDTVVQGVSCREMGVRFSAYPVLTFTASPGLPGDSGSLVRLETGEAVGIYRGQQRPVDQAWPPTVGVAQNFAQAMHTLGAQPLRAAPPRT